MLALSTATSRACTLHGIPDSTGVLELVTFVENQFGIAVGDHELLPSNFDSLGAVHELIQRKRVTDDVLRR